MPPIAATTQIGTTYLEVNGQAYPLMACVLPDISWDVIPLPAQQGGRRLGQIRVGQLTVRFTPPSMAPLAGWIDGLTSGRVDPVELSVLHTDGNGKVRNSLMLKGCILTELRLPECSAAGKEIYAIEAVFEPERVEAGPLGGAVKSAAPGRAKKWLASNFVVTVPGLPSGRISRVGSLTLTRSLVNEDDRFGGRRLVGALSLSPLALTVTGPDFTPWRDAVLKLTASGAHGDPLAIGLELRDTTLTKVLANLGFQTIGLSGFSFDPSGGSSGAVTATATARFELETLKFQVA